jgi:repressor LexA
MQSEPTVKQKQFLAYFERKISLEGKSPSLRQAALEMGVSHAAVAQMLKALEEKGYVKRGGHYSREIYILNRTHETAGLHRWREIPIIGRVTAGMPLYAQQEWDGSLVIDGEVFRGRNLFALRIKGDSMKNVGILDDDLAVCEPRQYAQNGEIVVALIGGEEATVKRFFLHDDHIELRPENVDYPSMRYDFGEVLIQGKVIGIQRGPTGIG